MISAYGLEEVRALSTVNSWAGWSVSGCLVWRLRKNEKEASKANGRNDQVSRTRPLTPSYEDVPQWAIYWTFCAVMGVRDREQNEGQEESSELFPLWKGQSAAYLIIKTVKNLMGFALLYLSNDVSSIFLLKEKQGANLTFIHCFCKN